MSYKSEILESIDKLNASDKEFLLKFSSPILRKFMTKEEIKRSNQFVKMNLLTKGTSDDGKSNVIFYTDSFILNKL